MKKNPEFSPKRGVVVVKTPGLIKDAAKDIAQNVSAGAKDVVKNVSVGAKVVARSVGNSIKNVFNKITSIFSWK